MLEKKPLPEDMAARLPAARVQQLEASAKLFRGEPAAAPEKTVAAQVAAWTKGRQAQAAAGAMTAGRVASSRSILEHFRNYLGPQSDVTAIDVQKLAGFYHYCLAKVRTKERPEGWSVSYARAVFVVAKLSEWPGSGQES